MAIAFDNKGNFFTVASNSYTCTGSNVCLIVITEGGSGTPTVTYNGVSMTQQNQITDAGGNIYTLFTLLNASTGANTLATTGGGLNEVVAVSYSGVGSVSNVVQSTGGTTSVTLSLTAGATNSWLFGHSWSRAGPKASNSGTGVVNNIYDNTSNPTGFIGVGDSGAQPSGAYSMTFNNSSNNVETNAAGFSLNPPAAVSSVVSGFHYLSLMGVGT